MRTPFAPAATAIAPTLAGAGAACAPDPTADRGARLFDHGDSRVTRSEAEAAGEARLDRADANADGQLNLQEIPQERAAAASARLERRPAKRFESPGTNGDGAVARGEFADRAAQRFGRLDADGDGAPTRDGIAGGSRGGG
jgi:hypothetical protein